MEEGGGVDGRDTVQVSCQLGLGGDVRVGVCTATHTLQAIILILIYYPACMHTRSTEMAAFGGL